MHTVQYVLAAWWQDYVGKIFFSSYCSQYIPYRLSFRAARADQTLGTNQTKRVRGIFIAKHGNNMLSHGQ